VSVSGFTNQQHVALWKNNDTNSYLNHQSNEIRMKSILIMLAFVTGLIQCSKPVEKVTIPEDLKAKFAEMYPVADSINWEKEGGNYEVTFLQDKMETSVVLSPGGYILRSEAVIDTMLLPKTIKDYVATQLGRKPITTATRLTDQDGRISYEAEVDSTDYLFDGNGQYTGKEDEKNEDKDDKD
jgi:hypothetical protein